MMLNFLKDNQPEKINGLVNLIKTDLKLIQRVSDLINIDLDEKTQKEC